jgi:citrate lyase subunit beta/citryl-CoA lyase
MSSPSLHPRDVLFGASPPPPGLPVCDHYAGEPARMRKSLSLQSDMADRALFDVTLDLEDGAAVGREAEQARLVGDLVAGPLNRFGRVGVRVHDAAHPRFAADVDAVLRGAGPRLAYLMVPKVLGADQARDALSAIFETAAQAGVPAPRVHFLIETPAAVHEAHDIAALEGVESLSFGLMDFVSAHDLAIPASAMSAAGQFQHPLVLRAKLEIAAACHAHGKTPSHCVVTEYRDPSAVQAAARTAATQLGYTRMWSIHPDQIAPILAAFAPDPREVEDAAEILLTARKAQWAPISFRHTLHDRASYRYHWRLLERAWSTGQALPAQARSAFFEDLPV